jgi:hypothetical protein
MLAGDVVPAAAGYMAVAVAVVMPVVGDNLFQTSVFLSS